MLIAGWPRLSEWVAQVGSLWSLPVCLGGESKVSGTVLEIIAACVVWACPILVPDTFVTFVTRDTFVTRYWFLTPPDTFVTPPGCVSVYKYCISARRPPAMPLVAILGIVRLWLLTGRVDAPILHS